MMIPLHKKYCSIIKALFQCKIKGFEQQITNLTRLIPSCIHAFNRYHLLLNFYLPRGR